MKKLLLAMVSTSCIASAIADPAIELNNHDKIVFWGDSITDFGWYVPYVQLGLALKLRDKQVAVFNAGVGGDTTGRAMHRLSFDVFRHRPQYVAIALGENDLGRGLYTIAETTPQKDRYLTGAVRNVDAAIARIRQSGSEAILLGLTTYDQYSDLKTVKYPHYNSTGKARLNAEYRTLAEKKAIPFIDVFTPMTAIVSANPAAHFCGRDRIHPSRPGHLIVALEILKALGVTNRNASVVIADGHAATSNASVTNLQVSDATVEFEYRPATLPLPVDESYRTLAAVSTLPSQINQETIAIKGLASGNYALEVAGKPLAVFSANDLSTGVNIAALDTPNQRKAQALVPLMEQFSTHTVPLRKIAAMRKADMNDLASIDRTLDEWLEECRASPAFKGRTHAVETYRKYREQLPELEKKIADLTARMYAGAEPEACRIRFVPGK